jgi:hypothetical protein
MANVIDRLSGPIFPLLIQHGWNEVILQITLRIIIPGQNIDSQNNVD